MYYPIIDKLKEVMTDITAVKDKEPLIIEGIPTSETGGTWTGSYSDITSAFSNNIQVLFKIVIGSDTLIVPVIEYNANFSASGYFPLAIIDNTVVSVYGFLYPNNTFSIQVQKLR